MCSSENVDFSREEIAESTHLRPTCGPVSSVENVSTSLTLLLVFGTQLALLVGWRVGSPWTLLGSHLGGAGGRLCVAGD